MATTSDKRKRTRVVHVRLTPEEHAKAKLRADLSGLSVSAYFRAATLDSKPLRAERQPAINRQQVAKLIGQLGMLRQSLTDAAQAGDSARCEALMEGFERDFWELRALCFEALGREP